LLLTRAEATGYRETSLHADVMTFLHALASQGHDALHLTSFGQSPQGRELPLLVLSTRGVRTPEQAREIGLPVVLVMDGIHPGEVEGKEASLALVRELLQGEHDDLLDHFTLLVVPLFNPDGNDALDPQNRRLDLAHLQGQIGPVVGTRTQSEGINLNRDYLRQQALEMRLLQSRVCQPWAPDLTVDNHATNGSVHRFHMTVDIPHTVQSGRAEPIEFMRSRLVPDVMAAVRGHGLDSGWYGNFVEDERALDAGAEVDPAGAVGEGWMTYPHHPRFGSNYRGLTGRLDLLLECYSYLTFEERVRTARAWQLETLRWVARHKDDVRQVVETSRTPPAQVAVRYRLEARDEPVEVLTRSPRTLQGEPVSVRLRHFARFVGSRVVDRPRGYLVPAALGEHLRQHGLQVADARGQHEVEVATVQSLEGAAGSRKILEAGQSGELSVSWTRQIRSAPEGSRLVWTDQPLGAVAVYLCEPESDDGAVENGLLSPPAVGDEHAAWRLI
jgi:hypothetical protein